MTDCFIAPVQAKRTLRINRVGLTDSDEMPKSEIKGGSMQIDLQVLWKEKQGVIIRLIFMT